jgi:hypothetical protein
LTAILSTLTAFVAAGARPRTPLAKAIMLVLVIKLVGILGMTMFLFSNGTQSVNAAAIMRVIGPSESFQ